LKTVILCGGLGTRLAEQTHLKPKPMVEIGGRPILWHIMKIYEHYGHTEFVIALGYMGVFIKDYFLNYHAHQSDLTLKLKTGEVSYSNPTAEDWSVSLVDTGPASMTGGRLLRLARHLASETFMLTYGDGVADIDIAALLQFHRRHGRIATITAVRPSARFGGLHIENCAVTAFKEKPQSGEGWINGGFFVFEPGIFDFLQNDQTVLEQAPLESLATQGQLMAYEHEGHWQCMDTIRDRNALEALWQSGNAPWMRGAK
jgi:glucose-1-phosphate cytidylyltransferase